MFLFISDQIYKLLEPTKQFYKYFQLSFLFTKSNHFIQFLFIIVCTVVSYIQYNSTIVKVYLHGFQD